MELRQVLKKEKVLNLRLFIILRITKLILIIPWCH